MATAGMPSSLAYLHMSFRRVAPSSMEYSVWTCRCTKEPLASRQAVGSGPWPSEAALISSNWGMSGLPKAYSPSFAGVLQPLLPARPSSTARA